MLSVPYTIRPIDTWPGEGTHDRDRRYSPFKAANSATLDVLDRELHYLGADNVSLLMAVQDKDIRLDGQLRANARPAHPGVIVAFDSIHGPLKYAVDTFSDAWSNIRAVALALEALRKVDRYGVTKRGEQYTGWKQLAPPTGAQNRDDAAELIADLVDVWGSDRARVTDELLLRPMSDESKRYIRDALRVAHPDTGGSDAAFRKLQQAREILAVPA